MYSIKPLPEFTTWLYGLKDRLTRKRLQTRLRKAQLGNLGDVKPVGGGVFEMCEHFGAGWRMYYIQSGAILIVMLGGGDKSTQAADIAKAVELSATIGESAMTIIRIADLPEFDITEHLGSEEDISEYLTIILEENDPALLAVALGDIARARGMTEIAKASGITREALYKALRPGAHPRFDTISRVCAALGVRLVAQPAHV